MHIEGIFELTSPLHCASGQVRTRDGFDNGTGTVTQEIVTANGTDTIPVFPGNDIKGRLRRKAAHMLIQHIVSPQRKLSVELYVALTSGTGVGGITGSNPTVEEIQRARDHVYMGLLGGGNRMLRSRLLVNNLVPVLANTVAASMVPESYAQETGEGFTPYRIHAHAADNDKESVKRVALRGYDLIREYKSYCVDDAARLNRPHEVMEFIDDPVNTITAHQLQQTDKNNPTKKVSSIFVVQAIAPGTPMYFYMRFAPDTTDAHVGLALLALRDLVREQALGGKISTGMGRFIAKRLTLVNGEGTQIFTEERAAEHAELHANVQSYVKAAHAGLARCTYEETAAFFMSDSDDQDEKHESGKKTAKKRKAA